MPNNDAPLEAPVATPVAAANPVRREWHGLWLVDEYAWMRDDPDDTLGTYLRAERDFYDRATSHLQDLRGVLFREVEGRLLPTDESVSWQRGDCFYYMKSVTGSEYEQLVQSRNLGEAGRVVLDDATLADEPGGYVSVELREPSPDNRLLAYSFDTQGDEVYTLRFRDLTTGADRPDEIARTYEGGAWSADSTTFFYTVHDELYRPYQVWRHRIGDPQADDVLVFEEDDARFAVHVRASRSGHQIVIRSQSRDTSEVWLIDANSPATPPRVVRRRERGLEYDVEDDGDRLLIVTNDGAAEFRLMTAPQAAPGTWTPHLEARSDERLHACHPLRDHLVLELRRGGFPVIRIVPRNGAESWDLAAGDFDAPDGRIALMPRFPRGATTLTIEVQSIIDPPAWHDVDLATRERRERKRLDVPGHDAARYRTERRHAPAADGVLVPFDIAYRADTPLDGSAPCLMWGYGAYESCDDPWWDPALISLLDRGVVYVLTHPRGGGENGRTWWLDGRLEHKANTFTDHVAVANFLAGAAPDAKGGGGQAAIVDPARIVTRGLSAGGLLQAAVLNKAPQRFRAVVAEVPFVDVIGSMSDPNIPLTVNEWDEWGDPRRPDDFAWMHAYSPYDHPPESPRPPILATASLHDARVLVHEPAKWVARLRATAAPGDVTLFRVEMGAGSHVGPAGRYAHYRYEAEIYAFILDAMGLA